MSIVFFTLFAAEDGVLAEVQPAVGATIRLNRPQRLTPAKAAKMQYQAQLLLPDTASAAGAAPSMYQGILDRHNVYRARHQAAALTWDEAMASSTAAYAARCTFAHSNGPYGENIYMTSQMGNAAGALLAAVDAWYAEVSKYTNYATGGFSGATGHFTQVVWKGSSKLSCAAQACSGQGTMVFCNYSPAGNVMGQFPANVLPPVNSGNPPPVQPPPSNPPVVIPPPINPPPLPPTPVNPPAPGTPPAGGTDTLTAGGKLYSPACLVSADTRFNLCINVSRTHAGMAVAFEGLVGDEPVGFLRGCQL
eukprot:gene5868-6109_t